MTYTFTLQVYDTATNQTVYVEYHNFREFADEFIYYRGGSHHPLEITVPRQNAIDSMNKLFADGWTCENPKIVKICF
jgi:hypothetical protein